MEDHSSSIRNRLERRLLSRLRKASPRMRKIGVFAGLVAVILAVLTIIVLGQVLLAYGQAGEKGASYNECQNAANQFQETSDFLTNNSRKFADEGDRHSLDDYLAEVYGGKHREEAIQKLQKHASTDEALKTLKRALVLSDELAQTELNALRLAAEGYGLTDLPESLSQVQLAADEQALSPQEKLEAAHRILFGDEYGRKKFAIREQVQSCSNLLVDSLQRDLDQNNTRLNLLLTLMYIFVIMLVLVVLFVIVSTNYLLLWPISLHEESIRKDEPLISGGAQELRYLTDTYNQMYEKNHLKTESLQYEARYDALTGILNRASYDQLLFQHRHDSALVLVDIDLFKNFNDDYGHEMGDAILIEVAATLFSSFRSSDHICRIGGDEFAVIVTNVGPQHKEVIAAKIRKVALFLLDTENGLPPVTISVGVAFGDYGSTEDSLFKAADKALYATKRRGRDGYTFADDVEDIEDEDA